MFKIIFTILSISIVSNGSAREKAIKPPLIPLKSSQNKENHHKIKQEDKIANGIKAEILKRFAKESKDKKEMGELQKYVLDNAGKSVPALLEVMKSSDYPDKNRWVATFLVGQIMGKKSVPLMVRYAEHPSWVLRMASLKTLLALKQKEQKKLYAKMLNDDSLLVRTQALENIKILELKDLAPSVWAMLYDKKNYYSPSKKGQELAKKRGHIIHEAIKTVGDLKFEKAQTPLLSMIQNDRYKDIFEQMNYSLEKITGKKAPTSDRASIKRFWKTISVSQKTF